MVKKIIFSIFLTLVILASSFYFIFNNESSFKVLIENTRTQYFINESNSWDLAATEYVYLYDGATKMKASSRNIGWYNDSNYVYAIRTSVWKDNITTIQTYTFNINENKIKNVPIRNEFQCINCLGKIVQFEIRDITYEGITKEITSPFSFGKNMQIEWQEGSYYSKVFKQLIGDKILIKYKPQTNNEKYNVRLYDPHPDYKYELIVYATGINEVGLEINNVLVTEVGTGIYKINTSNSDNEVSRALIMKTLFYGTTGSDPRGNSSYINATAIYSNDIRDNNKRGHYIYATSTGGGGTRTYNGTFADTSSNNNCSSWSRMYVSGASSSISYQMPQGTTLNSATFVSDPVTSDEIGTDTSSEEKLNPASAFITGVAFATQEARLILFCEGNITWVNAGAFDSATNVDFYLNYSLPLFQYLSSSINLNSPANNYTSTISNVSYNITYFSNGAETLSNVSLWTNESGTWEIKNSTTGLSINLTTQVYQRNYTSDNSFIWGGQACLSDGNCTFSLTNRTINVNSYPPSINITYPESLTYFENVTQLNYSAYDMFSDKCWFSNDSGATNYSVQTSGNNFTINTIFGENNYIVYCNDTNNNQGLDTISFNKSHINFTGYATNNTSPANFNNQNWIYLSVYTFNDSRANITFNLYTDGGYLENYTFANYTNQYNFTSLSLDYYFFNATICYNDSSGCFTTEERYYGNQTVNITLNNNTQNVIAELGTPVNLSAVTNVGNVSFDISHPSYGTVQNSSFLTSTLNLIISYFRNNLFSNSSTINTLNYSAINTSNNQTTFNVSNFSIPVHQYDYVDNLSINLSGNLTKGNSTIYEPQIIIYNSDNSSIIDRAFYGDLVGSNIYINKVFDNSNGTNLYLNATNVSFDNNGDKLIYFYLDNNAKLVNFTLNVTGYQTGFNFTDNLSLTNYKDTVLSNTTNFNGWELIKGTNPLSFLIDAFNDSSINTTIWNVQANDSYDGGTTEYSQSKTKNEGSNGLSITSSLSQNLDNGESDASSFLHAISVGDTSFLNMYSNNYYTVNLSYSGTGTERGSTQQCEPHVYFYAGNTKLFETYGTWSCSDSAEMGTCIFTQTGDLFFNISKNYTTNKFNYKISGTETYTTTEYGVCGTYTIINNWTNSSWSQTSSSCGSSNGLLNNSGNFTLTDYTKPINISTYTYASGTKYATTNSCVGNGIIYIYLNGVPIPYGCSFASDQSTCESAIWDEGSCSWSTSYSGLKGCSSVSNTVTINDAYQELNSIANSTYISKSVFDSSNDITYLTFSPSYNGLASLFVSADDGSNYQNVVLNGLTSIINPGKNVKTKINLITNGGYLTNIPFIDVNNINSSGDWPSNITFDFGYDNVNDANISGYLNTTNGTLTKELTNADISDGFSGTAEAGKTWLVPLKIHSDTAGTVQINGINLTYDPNPVYLNITAIRNSIKNLINFSSLNISIGSIFGTLNLTDLRYDYSGGNKTYTILAHNPDYTVNNSLNITYYFSQWDYNWAPNNVEWIYFSPKTPTSKNVLAYGSTNSTPILNITSLAYGNGGKNSTLEFRLNDTLSCVNTTLSFDSNKSNGTILTINWVNMANLTYLQTKDIWMWGDYNCNYSNWYLYKPSLYIRSCIQEGVCSEEII